MEAGECANLSVSRLINILSVLELTLAIVPESPLPTLDDIIRDREAESNQEEDRQQRYGGSQRRRMRRE